MRTKYRTQLSSFPMASSVETWHVVLGLLPLVELVPATAGAEWCQGKLHLPGLDSPLCNNNVVISETSPQFLCERAVSTKSIYIQQFADLAKIKLYKYLAFQLNDDCCLATTILSLDFNNILQDLKESTCCVKCIKRIFLCFWDRQYIINFLKKRDHYS